MGIRTGPLTRRNDAPCSRCNFRSSMAAQIHMAGSIWTKARRQLNSSSRRPWNSMARAPTANARGARMRRRWLSWTTAASTMASLPSRIARMSPPMCFHTPARPSRRDTPMPGVVTAAASWATPLEAVDIPFTWSSAMAAWPAHSPGRSPRVGSHRDGELRQDGTNGGSGDAAERNGCSLLMNPVMRRHAPSKAPGRVSRPHPSRVCLRAG
jgi:hypothetical protein